ncbi:hypothetical protein Tco_0222521 [Tanacetum coccineum]
MFSPYLLPPHHLSLLLITTSSAFPPPLPISSPSPNSPTYVEGSLGSRAARIRQREALPSPIHETEMPEICLPLRKRPCRTTPWSLDTGQEEFRQLVLLGILETCHSWGRHPGDCTVHPEGSIREFLIGYYCLTRRMRSYFSGWMMHGTFRGHITPDYGYGSNSPEITDFFSTDRRRQTVITDLLKADHRRQRQLVETLKIVKSLKTQMIELQRQQGPAKDPAVPELPEEASSSS